MSKINLVTRNLMLSKEMQAALDDYVTTDKKVTPGQLRRRDNWYFLTFLKVVKLKNFDLGLWSMAETEVDCIRATAFMIQKGKLLVMGTKSDVKEVKELLDALALKVAGNKDDQLVNMDDFYKIEAPEVDLDLVLNRYEGKRQVADVRKLVLKDMEVKLGSVKRAVISTSDYGGVKKLLQATDNSAVAVEISLKDPDKTFIYIDLDGQVRLQSASIDEQLDVEKLALECALAL